MVSYTSFLHSILEHGNFLNSEISQGSLATRLKCGEMFTNDFCKFTNESVSEIILRNRWHLVKLLQKSNVLFFSDSQCIYCRSSVRSLRRQVTTPSS